MIKKFISLNNIGRFHNYSCKGDIELRKVNLFYAGNGFGKTTLCAVLRSVQSGNANFLFERKTLGKDGAPEAKIKCNSGVVKFMDGAWDETIPNIAVFDTTFVHENVFAGDSVDHEHRRNLYRVIVGKQGVDLAKKVEELDAKIRGTNANLRTKEAAVQSHVPQDMSIEQFLALHEDRDLDAKIKIKESEIQSLRDAEAIHSTSLLGTINLPPLPGNFKHILAKTFDDVARDAEACVKDHVTKYQLGGDEWISTGLDHIHDDTCPFCEQNIEGSVLIAAYRDYFNQAYRSFKREVESLNRQVQSELSDRTILGVKEVIQDNERLIEFWKKHLEHLDAPPVKFERDIYAPMQALRQGATALAAQKRQAPLDVVVIDDSFQQVCQQVYESRKTTEIYNKTIETLNKCIQEIQDSTAAGTISETENALLHLETVKKRYTPQVTTVVEDYKETKKVKETLEEEKTRAKEELDQHSETVMVEYQEEINKLFDRFNTEFRITKTGRDYRGGMPRSKYQLCINDTTVELEGGDRQPCFKNTLSSGDRSTLALAFFITKLEQDPDIERKIVVLDDPFTSLDRFRRNCTRDIILKLARKAEQIIVFSHDPLFLKIVYDQLPSGNVKTLQLSKIGKSAIITEWDIEEETKIGYFKDHDDLVAFVFDGTGTGDLLSVARKIRPVMEGWLRYRFPKQFTPNEWLGDMTKKIQEAGDNQPLSQLTDIFDDLHDIKEYAKKYHHDQINPADNEPIDPIELEGFVKRALKLMGSY